MSDDRTCLPGMSHQSQVGQPPTGRWFKDVCSWPVASPIVTTACLGAMAILCQATRCFMPRRWIVHCRTAAARQPLVVLQPRSRSLTSCRARVHEAAWHVHELSPDAARPAAAPPRSGMSPALRQAGVRSQCWSGHSQQYSPAEARCDAAIVCNHPWAVMRGTARQTGPLHGGGHGREAQAKPTAHPTNPPSRCHVESGSPSRPLPALAAACGARTHTLPACQVAEPQASCRPQLGSVVSAAELELRPGSS